MHIDNKGPRITEADLDGFEATMGRALPLDYRTFLLSFNGGVPRSEANGRILAIYFAGKPHTSADVRNLLGLRDVYSYSLVRISEVLRDRVPDGYLPLGRTSGGDLYLIQLQGERRGEVVFWDHENEAPEGEEPRTDNIVAVAASFTEFLSKLEVPRHDPSGSTASRQ